MASKPAAQNTGGKSPAALKKTAPKASPTGRRSQPNIQNIPVKRPKNSIPLPEEPVEPVAVMNIDQVADKDIRRELTDRIREAHELKQAEKDIKRRLSGVKADPKKGRVKEMGLMEEIAILMREINTKTLYVPTTDGRVIENTYYKGTNVTLSAAKLIANGVSAEVIEESKDKKTYYTCVTKLKGEAGDEE